MILPLSDKGITAFFTLNRHMYQRTPDSRDYIEPTEYHSFSHVSSYRSALKDLYKQRNVPVPPSTERILSNFMAGYVRKVVHLKQTGDMALVDGK